MSTIVTRSGKGSPLSHVEVDANFTNLNTDKIQSGNTVAALTITSATISGGTASLSTLTAPVVQATNSAGLALKNSAGTTQISMGAGGGDNISINSSTNINGTNAQIDISPTGTGHVHINPSGSGSVEMNPTSVGTIDNMTIGATTAKNGSFINLSVTGTTSFDGSQGTSGQVLTSAGTGATPTWTTISSGSGTVTSVAATVPSLLSVTGSPITTSGTLAFTYSGTALPVANGGTGLTSTPTNGQLDIGNGTGFTRAALTAGTGISITNGAGSITVASTASSGSFIRISGGTLTAASAITADSIFTSTYKNYRIYINTIYSGADDTDAFLQFRASGSTNSTSNYVYQTNYINAAVNAGTAASSTGATSFTLYDNMDNSGPFVGWLEILNPQVSELTEAQWFLYANDGTNRKQMLGFGMQNQSTSFDGFTLTLSAGTLTGTYDIYGIAR
jgi:hypothetical protein